MTDLLNIRAWAMKEDVFLRLAPLVERRIREGKGLEVFRNHASVEDSIMESPQLQDSQRAKPKEGTAVAQISVNGRFKVMYDWDLGFPYYEDEEGNRIASISNVGTMMKYGICGGGMKATMDKLHRAFNSKSIKGIVMVCDSPGGSVDGTPELAETVRQANKPVVTFVDGLCASAAVWVASQSTHIMLNQYNYTEMGSIGVLSTLLDETGWLSKEGLIVRIMRADQSKDKALLNSLEQWPQSELDQLQKELNDIADDFKNVVLGGRGMKLKAGEENLFTGKMYDMRQCIEYGLADSIGTLPQAIELAMKIS